MRKVVSNKGQACLVTVFHNSGLPAYPVTQPVGLLGGEGLEIADTVAKGGVGIGRQSNLLTP